MIADTPLMTSFAARFGNGEADRVVAAATEHNSNVHGRVGSDLFRWAVAIAIGYQCCEIDRYRAYHGIEASWEDIKEWIVNEADLGSHDGDVDYLALAAGVYQDFIKEQS